MRSKVVAVSALMIAGVLQLGSATPAAAGTARHVWAWGSNSRGELGVGTTMDVPSPVNGPAVGAPFMRISSGDGGSTYGITSDGTAWSWGGNNLGQLGNGTTTGSAVPVPISVPSGVRFTRVSAGA